jgi:hypothetical protein
VHIIATSEEDVVYEGTSGCFSTYSEAKSITSIVASTALSADKQLTDLADVRAQTYGQHVSDYHRTIVLEFDSWKSAAAIEISLNASACTELVTLARWNDPSQWDGDEVPDELADVVLPHGAGMIQLDRDVQIASLRMEDGTLLMHRTDCQPGWSPGSYLFSGCVGASIGLFRFVNAHKLCLGLHQAQMLPPLRRTQDTRRSPVLLRGPLSRRKQLDAASV